VNATYVCEKGPSRSTIHRYEEEIARRWWALPRNMYLPLSNGESCQLLYAGRPGGSLGPDVRDAVLHFTSRRSATTFSNVSSQQAENTVGDVEIHIRASDWFAHQHHTDMRYNNVILHIVLICDDSRPTLRQDGTTIPTCSLNDLPSTVHAHQPLQWPCHHIIAQMNDEERACLFTLAGTLRFELKTQAFFEPLQLAQPSDIFSMYDVCLIPALAEGLGYGRDRAFFHAVGLHLIGAANSIPEPLGRAPQPAPLDSSRLHILRNLVAQWRTTGAWDTFRQALLATSTENAHPRRGGCGVEQGGDACVALAGDDHPGQTSRTPTENALPRRGGRGVEQGGDACVALAGDHSPSQTSRTPTQGDASVPTPPYPTPAPTRILAGLQKLRNIFDGLGTARTDILICNIVLPFATAVAQLENNPMLAEHARNLYVTYPGLPSNQITRAMCKQLLLKNEPKGACQQQGLHFIYAQTCREKRCTECIIGKQNA
jgi:Protein of unknown function (DUF2851)